MNDDSQQRDRLVGDLFHGDWATGTPAAFAAQAARSARRRQLARRGAVPFLTAATLLAVALFWTRPPAVAPAPVLAANPVAGPGYEIISDRDLLLLLHDRPLLVLRGETGGTQLTLLTAK